MTSSTLDILKADQANMKRFRGISWNLIMYMCFVEDNLGVYMITLIG
jgi:hypothetical protein